MVGDLSGYIDFVSESGAFYIPVLIGDDSGTFTATQPTAAENILTSDNSKFFKTVSYYLSIVDGKGVFSSSYGENNVKYTIQKYESNSVTYLMVSSYKGTTINGQSIFDISVFSDWLLAMAIKPSSGEIAVILLKPNERSAEQTAGVWNNRPYPINIGYGPGPIIVNFYRSSPDGDINVNRGETVNLEFTAVYEDGSTVTPYTDVVYSNLPPESTAIFNGNSFTISDNCRASIFTSIAKPNIGETNLYAFVQAKISNPVNPYLPDNGGISGGGAQSGSSNAIGSFDGTPGPSIVENLPNGSSGPDIASSGMYTKYLCNNALLDLLAGFFWEDNIGIQALKAVLGNPIDSIISLTAYPFALETLVPTTQTTIYFGQYDSHFSAFSLTKSSFQIDWGSVTIPFFWGSFLDYSPYTKIQLYLPWGVGFVSLDPNEVVPWSSKNSFHQGDFVNGTIQVITNIELDKGACVHNIIGNNGRIIGSFGGVVGKQVPVTGSDNSARILAMISAAVSSSAAIGTSAGGTLAAGKNLAYGRGMSTAERAEGREMIGNYKSYVGNTVQSLSNALSSPPSYPRAGTFSDATNTLGYQYPYLIISRPSQSVPQQYGRFMGYPSNIFHAHLGEVRGYTEVSSIHLENINATADELDELESILKGGVLL